VSNELSYAQTVPHVESLRRDGVYLGIGPEQNFTFIAAMAPRLAFIVDIRRENLLLHLLYKAVFELSDDRASFLSRLFGRPSPTRLQRSAPARELLRHYAAVPKEAGLFRRYVAEIRRQLTEVHGFPLNSDDLSTIERLHGLLYEHGTAISYTSTHQTRIAAPVTFAVLMSQTDTRMRELSVLATEERYGAVRQRQIRNVVVPVVGNVAGPKTIRAIGTHLRASGAFVTAFYVSNVEDYLAPAQVPPNGRWSDFCANVATLPLTGDSVFVRPAGLAWRTPDGRLLFRSEMALGLPEPLERFLYTQPELPSPMFPILPEVRRCD